MTAYEMRISDWLSDVCSSDLAPTDLLIGVPTLAGLDKRGVAVEISVIGTAGRSLEIDSVSGDITVAGAPRKADIESVSGDLKLTLNSADVEAQSVSGSINLRGRLDGRVEAETVRSEEHTSELQSLMRISYAVFCLNKKKP